MEKGKFVYHTSGWGTGEIMEISPVREQVAIEFENVLGIKHISFDNAFKNSSSFKQGPLFSKTVCKS